MVTRLDSSHVFHRMTRLESQSMTRDSSQSHFWKISEPLIDKPSLFACKEMIIFCSSNDQNLCKFSLLTFKSCYTISKGSSIHNLHRGRPEICFSLRGQKQGRTQGGLGLTLPPLNLLCYKNVITYAKEFVYAFVHFLLVWCQLNAKTTEWFCMKISRNTVNGRKRNNYILVGIWVIACIIQEPSHHFLQTSRRLRIFMLVLRVVHFIRNNCLYFVRSARALTVLAWLLYQLLWHGRTS